MNSSNSFKLIDGSFTESEAREVLMSMISAKLKFHSLKKFSDLERFGLDTMQSEARIKQLNELVKEIKSILDDVKNTDCVIKITSDIQIHITQKGK